MKAIHSTKICKKSYYIIRRIIIEITISAVVQKYIVFFYLI